MKTFICILLISLSTSFAEAGWGTGRITRILPHSGNLLMFYMEVANQPPPCATQTQQAKRYVVSTKEKALAAGIFLAYAQKKAITVAGIHGCSDWGDTESVIYFVSDD